MYVYEFMCVYVCVFMGMKLCVGVCTCAWVMTHTKS